MAEIPRKWLTPLGRPREFVNRLHATGESYNSDQNNLTCGLGADT